MSQNIKTLVRSVLGMAVVIITGIATLYVLDVIEGADAKEIAVKAIMVLGIIGIAATALLALGGSSEKQAETK